MMIEIIYEFTSASGAPIRRTIVTDSYGAAEDVCKNIDKNGYRLIDVIRTE